LERGRHRSFDEAQTIFGENVDGTLVRDRYAAYNGIGGDWQVCLAHILTHAKAIRAEHALLPHTEKDPATGPFCDRLRDLCARLCEMTRISRCPWKIWPGELVILMSGWKFPEGRSFKASLGNFFGTGEIIRGSWSGFGK
jgi:hypothetical protein